MSHLIHAILVRMLPRELRARQGAAMAEAFATALQAARARSRVAFVKTWAHEASDLVRTAIALRAGPRLGHGNRRGAGPAPPWHPRGRPVAALLGDLRSARRALTRRPTFTLFAAATMALGIGAATSVFSTVEAVILNPLPYPAGERMLALFENSGSDSMFLSAGHENVERWRAQQDLFEAVEPIGTTRMRLTGDGAARMVDVALIRPGFHEMVDRQPLIGRSFTADEMKGEGAHVLLLDHGFWRTRFGADPDVLGQTLQLNGEPWTIIGVMPPATVLPMLGDSRRDLWLPFSERRQTRGSSVTALMRDGVTLDDVNRRFERLHAQALKEAPDQETRRGVGLLVGQTRGDLLREPLRLLAVAVGLLVLIACINVANLLLGGASARRSDTAVRLALGASWWNIFRQILAQSVMLSILGGAGGVLLTRLGLAAMVALRPDNVAELDGAAINGAVLFFTVVIAILAGVMAGLIPAMTAGRGHATEMLRRRATGAGIAGRRLRWALITGEVALSFALLAGCLQVAADLYRLQSVDVGFDADTLAVVGVSLPPWRYQEAAERQLIWDRLAESLAGLEGVERMTAGSSLPPHVAVSFGKVSVGGGPVGDKTELFFGPLIDESYFSTLGQRVVAGRPFTAEEIRDHADVVIIGEETARRFFGDRSPVGAHLRIGGTAGDYGDWTIIGVTADVAMSGPADRQILQMYRPSFGGEQVGYYRTFVLRAGISRDPAALLPVARQVVLAADPDILVSELATGDDLMIATLGRQRFLTSLLAVFAGLALLLAAVGLYGVITQLVGQRTREFGIRMALGADGGRIRAMVLRGGASAIAVGVAIGLPLVWLGTRLTATKIFEDVGGGSGAYIGAAVVLALIALAASYVPTRRATRIDPVRAIRES